jgi:hypothetical protein
LNRLSKVLEIKQEKLVRELREAKHLTHKLEEVVSTKSHERVIVSGGKARVVTVVKHENVGGKVISSHHTTDGVVVIKQTQGGKVVNHLIQKKMYCLRS